MYRGYNVDLQYWEYQKLYDNIDKSSFKNVNALVERKLATFINNDGTLDGTKMTADWFPEIKADIFISHAHFDEKMAIALSGWLATNFGLTCFIDSCVWKYGDKLIKMIDDSFRAKGSKTYNYQQRNLSTSHVHMMLSTALSNMMDRTECLFFLNTPSSITPTLTLNKTYSPWIYSEIAMSRLIRQRALAEHRQIIESKEILKGFSKGIDIGYEVKLDHLTNLDINDLNFWKKLDDRKKGTYSLDILYSINPIEPQSP